MSISSTGMTGAYVGELLDILGPRSTEHERLTIGPDLGNNLSDLGLETHVKHAVSLVQDEIRDAAKISLLSFQHVDKAAWSGNDNFDAPGQVANLRAFWSTAINCGVANSRIGAGKNQNSNSIAIEDPYPNLVHSCWI